jgi:hypothetical protein
MSDTELCDVSIIGMLRTQREYYEAQLAKAVDAIDGLLAVLPDDEGPEIDYARTTIAELKGEK